MSALSPQRRWTNFLASRAATTQAAEDALVRWLRAMVWGAALLPLLAFLAAAWWGHRVAYIEARSGATNASQVASQHAEQVFKVAFDALERTRMLTSRPEDEMRQREAELHERLMDLALGLPPGSALSAFSAAGKVIVAGNLYPVNADVDYTDREYFRRLKNEPALAMYVTDVFVGRQSGKANFSIAVPRRNAAGEFDGVIMATLPPAYFFEFYKSLAPEHSLNSFALLREDGAILTRWPPPPVALTRAPAASLALPAFGARQASGVMSVQSTFDGERRLISFQRVPGLPLYVVAGISERFILASWYRYLQWLAAILLPITLLLVYVAWLALQRVRRLQVMAQALEAESQRRNRAEVALVEAQKLEALGQLTGGVAHDFNNLLGIVSNNVHLMQRGLPQGTLSAPLAAIGRATASGVKLTRQLLSFARKQALKPELVSLQQWLPAVGDLLRTTLGNRARLTIEVQPDTATVRVDPSELELALINLAVNARHAMPEGAEVLIAATNLSDARAGEPQPGVCIRFIDRGSGIPADVIGRVFEPFFTTKAPGVGSGLGLSQVYGLCRQAGGSARIESVVDQGTTVTLVLPAQEEQAAPRREDGEPVPSRLHGCVLLVEDNDELAATQELLLRSAGLEVERVGRADRAESLVMGISAPYDMVLSDVMMPGPFDGIELAFRLRKSRPALPIILLTGYAHHIESAANAGFVVLGKPVEPAVLFAELARALERKRSH